MNTVDQQPQGWAKGKGGAVPEPSAYGAAFLVLVLALVVVRRINKLKDMK